MPEPTTTDWASSYSQYLARSAALSARTLSLYQLALEQVSQGKLPPTVFQDHFPGFAVAHSGDFMRRYSEVGSRFLSDLVRLTTSFSQTSGGNGGGTEPEIVPPTFDPANPARWYEDLAEYAGKMSARATKAYKSQLDRVAAGDTTPSEVQQQTAQQMADRLPSYMEAITQLYFQLLNGLNEVRSAYEETYFQGILSRSRPEEAEPPVVLTLAGPAGTTAAVSLSVTNMTEQRARIGCAAGGVRRVDGVGPSFTPAIAVSPEALELDPGQEGVLTLSLALDPEQFDAKALYAGTLELTGGSEVPVEVHLRVLASDAPPAAETPRETE